MNLNQLARDVITNNEYLTLATIDEFGKPWTCILAYAFDADYSFYFVSLPTANHSKHTVQNHDVSFTIFDSHQDFGKGVGLQGVGSVTEVQKEGFDSVSSTYFSRQYPYGNIHNEFMDGLKKLLEGGEYRFYKLTPQKIWINDPNADTDRRVEVDLKKAV
jgi:uncharacterized protein YhbP (UPF0306 family)